MPRKNTSRTKSSPRGLLSNKPKPKPKPKSKPKPKPKPKPTMRFLGGRVPSEIYEAVYSTAEADQRNGTQQMIYLLRKQLVTEGFLDSK